MQPEHGYAITGWASALPSTVVTNQDIMTLFDTSDDWIVERTGIRQRRAADGPFVHPKPSTSPPEGMGTTALLAAEAGRSALRMAGVTGADIDLLVLCTTSPDQLVPATSSPLGPRPGHKGRRHGHKRGLRRFYLRAGDGGRASSPAGPSVSC